MTKPFAPRASKTHYIKKRGDTYYYRRGIPADKRHLFDGKVEWNFPLEGRTKSERIAEAQAHAHYHNRQITLDESAVMQLTPNDIDGTLNMRLDFSPEATPAGFQMPPLEVYRDGKIIKTYKIAGGNDPDFLREAERDGYFSMSGAEYMAQVRLMKSRHAALKAVTPDGKELASLKTKNAVRDVKSTRASAESHTLLSAMPKWHKHSGALETTRKMHMQHSFTQAAKHLLQCSVNHRTGR